MSFWNGVKAALAAMLALWVGAPEAYRLLLAMNAIDVVSGLVAAGQRQEVSSKTGFLGMRKKGAMWLLVLSAHALQAAFDFPTIVAGYTPAEVVATSFIVVEGMSILENAVRVGLPIPPFIMDTLKQAQARFGMGERDKAGE